MNLKTVLLFSRDPGGCNSVAPLFSFFKERHFKPLLYAKDFSNRKMIDFFGLHPIDVLNEVPNLSEKAIEQWLAKLNPNIVITGTSFGDATERSIWLACKNLKITSFAILDHWINYAIRFKKEDGQYIFPDNIVVPDLDAKDLAVKEGLPSSALHVLGNPYYDFLRSWKSTQTIDKIRQKFLMDSNKDQLVVFASESISSSPAKFGYSEKEILEHLLNSIATRPENAPQVSVVVRPHPKEDFQDLIRICNRFQSSHLRTFVSSDENSIDLILASNLVCGMISQFLIETVVMKKSAISIQIGLNAKDPFILTQKGVLPLITNKNQLDGLIRNFHLNEKQRPSFEPPYQCMENILKMWKE